MSDAPQTAPPLGEEIHLPGPSIIPLLNAAGLSIAIVGAVAGKALVIGGGLLFLVTTIIWIRDAKRELDSLPADHHAGHAPSSQVAAEGEGTAAEEAAHKGPRKSKPSKRKQADPAPEPTGSADADGDGTPAGAVPASKLEK